MDIKEKVAISLLMDSNLSATSTENSSISDWSNSSFSLNEASSLTVSNKSSSSKENEECLLLFFLMKHLISGRKRHRVEDYINTVDSWTDSEFKEHLRINRITAILLIGNIY